MPTWKQIPSFIILGMFIANVIFDFGWFNTPNSYVHTSITSQSK